MPTDRGPRRKPLDHDPEALRYALAKSGLTQLALARAVDRSPGFISEVLAGTRNTGTALLPKLAAVLNCPVVVIEAKREARAAS